MNIFIVEDSKCSQECLQFILSDIPGITVIGRAAAVESDVVEVIETLVPDAVIFDIDPNNIAVMDMLESIKKYCHGMKVMILADCANEIDFNRCLYTGEDNFFDKDSQFMTIRAALWKWVYDCRLNSKLDAL